MSAAERVPAIRVVDLHEVFRIYDEVPPGIRERLATMRRAKFKEFHALNGITLDIMKGERVGLIGHNGSGKSTLLKCMAGILPADRGSVEIDGRIATLLELGAGFSPELTGRENIYLNGSILGLRRAEINESFDRIVDFAGVRDFIDTPVKNYSSGMYVRLGFAIAVHVDPDILLVDEVLAVGDASFAERSLARMRKFAEAGKTVVLVSHDMAAMEQMCDRIVLLEGGHVEFDGPAAQAIAEYERRLRAGHGASLTVPDLPEPSAGVKDEEQDGPAITGALRIESVTVSARDEEEDGTGVGEQDLRIQAGARVSVEVVAVPEEMLIGSGGLYVRLVLRRPDLPMPLYDSRTSYRVQYVAPPPVGEPIACTVDLKLNVLSGDYLLDVEVGNAETDVVHARESGVARIGVKAEPWDIGIVSLDATFRVHNPAGVWPPESEPPPVEEGGPAHHPDPLWPVGAPPPVEVP